MSTILVVGTYAIDFVGTYPKPFSTLPNAKSLNLSIQLGGMRKGFGGCAMNIAVTLHRLGHHAIPFADVGSAMDADYARHLIDVGLDQRGLKQSSEIALSAHALILTDPEENQFTAFYAGEPKKNFRADLEALMDSLVEPIEFVVIAPIEPQYMIPAAHVCRDRGLPFLCDPGQCTTAFSPEDCEALVEASSVMCFNRFEHEIFENHVRNLDQRLELTIVTQGSDGVRFKSKDTWHAERAAQPRKRIDPTGCGDAFRSGLVHAHLLNASWQDAVRAGCVLATINLEHVGTQNHDPTEFRNRYVNEWKDCPSWLEGSA